MINKQDKAIETFTHTYTNTHSSSPFTKYKRKLKFPTEYRDRCSLLALPTPPPFEDAGTNVPKIHTLFHTPQRLVKEKCREAGEVLSIHSNVKAAKRPLATLAGGK